MRIHCLQHAAFETPGSMLAWAAPLGHSWTYTALYAPAPQFPALPDFDWLVILGGAMGVHDEAEYPWLAAEKTFIRAAIAGGKTVLGICLGAQLVADALGARVHRNHELEIGFWPLLSPPGGAHPYFGPLPATVLHWHGDSFDLPEGAELLASSAACAHQAFRWQDRVVGLQFHPELTADILDDMLQHDGHELVPGPWVQTAAELRARTAELAAGRQFLFGLLDALTTVPGATGC